MQKNLSTKIIVRCALFLAIALVLRNISYTVPMGGVGGMRIGAAGFFYKLPSFVFGPLIGGIVCGLYDLLAYVIRPEGAYIFPMTIVMMIGGVVSGVVFRSIKKRTAKSLRTVYVVFIAAMGALGTFNHMSILFRPNGAWGAYILGMGKKAGFFVYGFYLVCLVGLLFYAVNLVLQKKSKADFANTYMKVFAAVLVSDIFVTTANTFVLMAFVPSLSNLGFMAFYLPRLAQELLSVFITSYFLTYFYCLYKKLDK